MKKIEFKKLNEFIYHEKLDNGLNVYLYPTSKTNTYHVSFFTKYGSIYNDFKYKYELKYKNYPLGIAHFLEHKLFESEKESAMEYFSKSGTKSNAFTSYNVTNYLIEGQEEYSDNLNYLIDFVQKPHLTYENVEKEKGIIEQEIYMYLDDPYYRLHEVNRFNLVNNHPIKYDIAGTVEDIKKITKEMLEDCYYTFYSPNNMYLLITGNIDVEDTIKIIKDNQNNKKFENKEYELKKYIEDEKVFKEYETINMNVSTPMISYGIKSRLKTNLNKIKQSIYFQLIFLENFDLISDFYYACLKNKKVLSPFGLMFTDFDDYYLAYIMAETTVPEVLLTDIKDKFNNLKLSKEYFNRFKKKLISNIIYYFEDHNDVNDYILGSIIDYGYPCEDIIDIYNELDYEEFVEFYNTLQFDNSSSLVIKNDRQK